VGNRSFHSRLNNHLNNRHKKNHTARESWFACFGLVVGMPTRSLLSFFEEVHEGWAKTDVHGLSKIYAKERCLSFVFPSVLSSSP